jgi:hypothetical protein
MMQGQQNIELNLGSFKINFIFFANNVAFSFTD